MVFAVRELWYEHNNNEQLAPWLALGYLGLSCCGVYCSVHAAAAGRREEEVLGCHHVCVVRGCMCAAVYLSIYTCLSVPHVPHRSDGTK